MWYVGCVIVFEDKNEVKFFATGFPFAVLRISIKGWYFHHVLVPIYDIIAKVDVATATGRTYRLEKKMSS